MWIEMVAVMWLKFVDEDSEMLKDGNVDEEYVEQHVPTTTPEFRNNLMYFSSAARSRSPPLDHAGQWRWDG